MLFRSVKLRRNGGARSLLRRIRRYQNSTEFGLRFHTLCTPSGAADSIATRIPPNQPRRFVHRCIGWLVYAWMPNLSCRVQVRAETFELESSFQGLRDVGTKALKIGHWSFEHKCNRQQRFPSTSASMSKQSAKLAK